MMAAPCARIATSVECMTAICSRALSAFSNAKRVTLRDTGIALERSSDESSRKLASMASGFRKTRLRGATGGVQSHHRRGGGATAS